MLMDIAPITVGDSRSMSSSSFLAPEEGEPRTSDGTISIVSSSGTRRYVSAAIPTKSIPIVMAIAPIKPITMKAEYAFERSDPSVI
jgi:hypothetical protein